MKKIFALIIMMIFVFSAATAAYGAGDTQTAISDKKAAMQQKREEIQVQIQERQELRTELQPLLNQIRANRGEVLQLKVEARTAQQAAIAHIKELKANPDKLSDAQVEQLKSAKDTLKESRSELARSVGEIKIQKSGLKTARLAKNNEQTEESLNNIIKIQQERVTLLKGIIEDLKAIATI